MSVIQQGDLFATKEQMQGLAERVPWQFRLKYREKNTGREDDGKVLAWSYYQGFRRARKDSANDETALDTIAERVRESIFNPERRVFAILGTHSRFGHWMISALYHSPSERNREGHSARRPTILKRKLYTIGYTGFSLPEFIATLTENGIECLIDVRQLPISRKKGFAKSALQAHLNDAGIEYRHFRLLGSPSVIRHELRETGDYDRFFAEVHRHIRTFDASQQLGEAVKHCSSAHVLPHVLLPRLDVLPPQMSC